MTKAIRKSATKSQRKPASKSKRIVRIEAQNRPVRLSDRSLLDFNSRIGGFVPRPARKLTERAAIREGLATMDALLLRMSIERTGSDKAARQLIKPGKSRKHQGAVEAFLLVAGHVWQARAYLFEQLHEAR